MITHEHSSGVGGSLSPKSLYVRTRITTEVYAQLAREGIRLTLPPDLWSTTIDQLLQICLRENPRTSPKTLQAALERARATAFDTKYAEYTYHHDSRGKDPLWQHAAFDALRRVGWEDVRDPRLLVVGVGNGLEAQGLYGDVRRLTIVDIAPLSLAMARARLPHATATQDPAENLTSVHSNSQDFYLALRVFQSALLNPLRAIHEARRVLTPGGAIVLSISSAFVDCDGRVVLGHVAPRSCSVDASRPVHHAHSIQRLLLRCGFSDADVAETRSDIYVTARNIER